MNQNVITTLEEVESAVLKFTYEKNNGERWGRKLDDLCKIINCKDENLLIDALKLMAGDNYFKRIEIYPPDIDPRPLIYDPKLHKIEKFFRSTGEFYITSNEKAHKRYEELSKKRLEDMTNKV